MALSDIHSNANQPVRVRKDEVISSRGVVVGLALVVRGYLCWKDHMHVVASNMVTLSEATHCVPVGAQHTWLDR
jgi:hypothetical protein